MASRVSITDVRAAWANYCETAKAVGFDPSDWHMQEGSSTMGVHFSAYTADGNPVPGAVYQGFNSRYLGTTRREAYDALRHITATLAAVLELRSAE